MRRRGSRRGNLHLVGKEAKDESPDTIVTGCEHYTELVDLIISKKITDEQAQQRRYEMGRHTVVGPGVAICLCTACFQKGSFCYSQNRYGKHILKWPILEVVKNDVQDEGSD